MENDIVIPAKSRYRLEAKTFPGLSKYVVNVKHDYFSKSVGFLAYDIMEKGKPVVHEWIIKTLERPGEEVFTLYHHDCNGNLLYKKILEGIKLIGHQCTHNYECEGADLQDHELFFTYEELKTINNVN